MIDFDPMNFRCFDGKFRQLKWTFGKKFSDNAERKIFSFDETRKQTWLEIASVCLLVSTFLGVFYQFQIRLSLLYAGCYLKLFFYISGKIIYSFFLVTGLQRPNLIISMQILLHEYNSKQHSLNFKTVKLALI